MNSVLGIASFWALRISVLVVLLCLPLMAGITYNWLKLKNINECHGKTQKVLFDHNLAEQKIKEKIRQQSKTKNTTKTILQSLFPLGSVLGDDIALLTLNASLKNNEVRLNIAAKSLSTLFDFTARLQNIPLHVELQNHQIAKDEKQEWPIRATINIHLSTGLKSEN